MALALAPALTLGSDRLVSTKVNQRQLTRPHKKKHPNSVCQHKNMELIHPWYLEDDQRSFFSFVGKCIGYTTLVGFYGVQIIINVLIGYVFSIPVNC